MTKESLLKVESQNTPSGVRLRAVPMEGTKTATVMVLVRTGSRNESLQNWGISHFLEHLFFKGSKKRPSTQKIARALDQVGGEFNAFTSKEITAFFATAASSHLELLMDVLGDMLLNPLLDPKDIEKEKGVIKEEINMYEDTPMDSIDDHWEELFFGGKSDLGRRIIGTKEKIDSFGKDDFRRYLSRHYVAGNAVVCVAGNVDKGEAFRLAKDYFGGFSGKKSGKVRKKSYRGTKSKKKVSYKEKQIDQAHVIMGGSGVSYTAPNRFVMDMLATILGGSMSSRLFSEIREKRGLAYYVKTDAEHYSDTGHLATRAGLDPERLESALHIIKREYKKISEKEVSKAELTRAREYIKGKMLLSMESSAAVARFVGGQEVLTGRILTVEDMFKRIDRVMPEDILKAAKKNLALNKIRLAVIGPPGYKGNAIKNFKK